MPDTYYNYIDGEWVESSSGETFESVEPADPSRSLGEFQDSNTGDVQEAVAAAVDAQEDWRALSRIDRAQYLKDFFIALDEREEELGELVSRECGKEFAEGKADVVEASHMARYAFGLARHPTGEVVESEIPAKDSYVHRKPVGVVGSIKPWNFPIALPLWDIAIALEEGNTMVFKPAEQTPKCGVRIMEIFDEIGLPDGVLNVVHGDREAVEAVLDHPEVQAVSFVGSSAVAQAIHQRATANGKRAQALGGAKNHMVVMPDADMDQAADALMGAAYGAAGERCMAVSVAVPVGEETGDALVERLAPRVRSLRVGPYTDPEADLGPVISRGAKERIEGYIDAGRRAGAELVVDGRSQTLQGYEHGHFLGGSLFDRVTTGMSIYQEEIFGPVLSVVR
ncbi:MAG: aldehyde dehydrogenase family protein, partial [Candidatus Nanohaloarchaea archaeon]|nr:aldehyde dehydrogenase family protein [Candidatus Nanohaloarchaea archaeon]